MEKDKERFAFYINSVCKGDAKINTKGLAPYEMVKAIMCKTNDYKLINQM